jgi:Zn-dependent peptidase ImmA (M78 family)
VEKYCDRRWGFPEDYLDLPAGVLGCAGFSESGLASIAISRELCEDTSRIGIARTRSTTAHEIGHGELHADAYAKKIRHDREQGNLFAESGVAAVNGFLCRDEQIRRPRSEEWWEVQANRFMVALLLPKHLLREAVENWMPHKKNGRFYPITRMLDDEIAGIFNVSKEMARIAGEAMQERIIMERQQEKAL